MTFVPHATGRRVERQAMAQTMAPARGERTTRHDIHAVVQRHVDDVARRLGVRPGVHVDWPARARVPAAVTAAIADALDESLGTLADHDGLTSAFVSVTWRAETVEVCVVDDGRPPASRAARPATHVDDASGVEHDIDDYGPVGTCQWWSIPTDL
jgi:hypothetical protein